MLMLLEEKADFFFRKYLFVWLSGPSWGAWDLSGPGTLASSALQSSFLTTEPPGKSLEGRFLTPSWNIN